jgi:hypothetical protein
MEFRKSWKLQLMRWCFINEWGYAVLRQTDEDKEVVGVEVVGRS